MTDINGLRGAVLIDPATGQPIAPALDATLNTAITRLASILQQLTTGTSAVSMAAVPTGGALDSSLQAIRALLQSQIEITSLFVIDTTTNKYYVRRESVNEGTGVVTTTFLNLDGTTPGSAPAVSNLTPIVGGSTGGGGALAFQTATYDVTTAFTGAAVGDILVRAIFETAAGGSPTAAWYNVTQGTLLTSAPSSANVIENTKNVLATLAAGVAIIGKVGIDQTAPGTTNGVVVNAVARNLIFSPLATAVALPVGQQSATAERVCGAVAGGVSGPWQTYRVFARSDQAFTLNIFGRSVSNGANVLVATVAVPANTPTFLSVPAIYPILLTQITNGSIAATAFSLTDQFSAN